MTRGRKPKKDAQRRGGKQPQPVVLEARVLDEAAPALSKPPRVAANPTMSACWDALLDGAVDFMQADVPLLESYCFWYAVLRQAEDQVVMPDGRVATLVSRRDEEGNQDFDSIRANPDLRTAEKATNMLRQLGDALNISPTARVRSGLMRAMTASTQAEMVARTQAAFEQFKREQGRLNAAE